MIQNLDIARAYLIEANNDYDVYPVNDLTESPQSTQRAQSSAIPVTIYETADASRFRTRMTRIARIFTDPCASVSSVQSVFNYISSAFVYTTSLRE